MVATVWFSAIVTELGSETPGESAERATVSPPGNAGAAKNTDIPNITGWFLRVISAGDTEMSEIFRLVV